MQGMEAIFVWIGGIIMLALGLYLGMVYGKKEAISGAGNEDALRQKLSRTKDEYKAYRDSVGESFARIRASVDQFHKVYGSLFEHLADGGQRLSEAGADAMRLIAPDSDFMAKVQQSNPEEQKRGTS